MTKTKIKLTQEQAKAIERFLRYPENSTEGLLNLHSDGSDWLDEFETLNDLSQADLAKALLLGYEVEPKLDVGDWATRKKSRRTIRHRSDREGVAFQIEEIGIGVLGSDGNNHSLGALRRATYEEFVKEQEWQRWAEIGRAIGEIREGDIGVGNSGLKMICKHEIEKAHALNSLIGFYPTESYVCLLDGDADV